MKDLPPNTVDPDRFRDPVKTEVGTDLTGWAFGGLHLHRIAHTIIRNTNDVNDSLTLRKILPNNIVCGFDDFRGLDGLSLHNGWLGRLWLWRDMWLGRLWLWRGLWLRLLGCAFHGIPLARVLGCRQLRGNL